jgi:hypothetical protein
MATKTTDPKGDAPTEAAARSAKKKPKILIGVLGAGALMGAVLAVVAVPKQAGPKPAIEGPFVVSLAKEDVQVNLAGENGKRYLVLGLKAECFAYDEAYVTARLGSADAGGEPTGAEDPLYTAMLKDLLLRMAGRKTREQVEDPVQMEAFLMEIRSAVEPLLFPVCVGDSTAPKTPDSESGLRVGESIMDSTFRGLLHEHALQVDAVRKTVRLDDGPEVGFTGTERDLRLMSAAGESVYVNVSGLDEHFVGAVPIGVPGRVRKIYRGQVLVQ